MIGDVLLECELEPGEKRTLAGFENHAGRTRLDPGATPLGRVLAGFGNDGESGFEGCRAGRVLGTYLHGPLLPRNPWLADWLLAQALAHRTGSAEAPWLEPLDEELETDAHTVSAQRARDRLAQLGRLRGHVPGDEELLAVLAAADVEKVVVARPELLADADRLHLEPVPAPLRPACEDGDVPTIGVDVEVVRVQVADADVHAARSQ